MEYLPRYSRSHSYGCLLDLPAHHVVVLKDSGPQIFSDSSCIISPRLSASSLRRFAASAAATLLAEGFVECHTLALKQTVYVGVTMLVVLLTAMDAPVSAASGIVSSRRFLLVLYVVFLVCHFFLPKSLADQTSRENTRSGEDFIGPVDKAREMAKWIEETAAIAFGMSGSVTDDDREESRILHVTRVSGVGMLERIIRNEGIKQILLLEIPLDPEGLGLVVKVQGGRCSPSCPE